MCSIRKLLLDDDIKACGSITEAKSQSPKTEAYKVPGCLPCNLTHVAHLTRGFWYAVHHNVYG